jgi:predicted RNA-binding Zn-ribbon protein involved in translation (DUF1610 family)
MTAAWVSKGKTEAGIYLSHIFPLIQCPSCGKCFIMLWIYNITSDDITWRDSGAFDSAAATPETAANFCPYCGKAIDELG